ncbi:MAG: YceD family protein [Desulfurivibrionaceae bacterium]
MRIRWDEIPVDGLLLRIDDGAWIPRNEIVCQGSGACTISLNREGGRVLLAGTLLLPVVLECDRCLDHFVHTVDEEFEIVFELLAQGEEAGIASDHLCKSNELDVVCLAEPVVDVFSVLAQQLFLALPEKRLCGDKCSGLCPGCGASLNHGPCDCSRGTGSSPFSVLAKLKVR